MRLRLVAGAGLVAATLAGPAPACEDGRITLAAPGGAVTYTVEIADDPAEQAQGLMFRTELGADAGMLFVFDRPRQARFWMRNTYIPLDIVFLDERGQVLNVAERTVPFSEELIPSKGDALAVLEVNAGEAARHGIGPGTQAVHPAFPLAPDPYRCGE